VTEASASQESSKERLRGSGFVLAAALAWSGGGLGVKLINESSLTIAGYRSLFAIPVLAAAFMYHARNSPLAPSASLRALLGRRHVWGAAVGYAAMLVCFVLATKRTTAANAILLQYTAPIYVALLSWPLLAERVRAWDWLAVVGCVIGMGLFFSDRVSTGTGQIGNLIAIASSFGFASYPLFLRLAQKQLDREGEEGARLVPMLPLVAPILGNALAVVVCLPSMITSAPSSALAWSVLFALGTLQIGFAYVLYGSGVRRLRAVESTLLCTIEPILSPIWVVLVMGEQPSLNAIAGGAIIVVAVTGQGVAAGLARARESGFARGER
jgi:DME family drug/metabolite transporter